MSQMRIALLGLAAASLVLTSVPSFAQESGGCGGMFSFFCPQAPAPAPVMEPAPEPAPPPMKAHAKKKKPHPKVAKTAPAAAQ